MKLASDHSTHAATRAQRKPVDAPFFSPMRAKDGSDVSKSEAFFQPKLKVGAPNDKYEREADAVADRVVRRMTEYQTRPPVPGRVNEQSGQGEVPARRAPVHQVPTASSIQRSSPDTETTSEKEPEEESPVRRKAVFENGSDDGEVRRKCNSCGGHDEEIGVRRFALSPSLPPRVQRNCAACEAEEGIQPKVPSTLQRSGDGSFTASDGFSAQLNTSKGGGSPLPADTRYGMESAIGADFSGVRIHTGSQAAGLSNQIGAQAFTHGSDVYFNKGKYDPGSAGGQHLLAHELTHTVQQGASVHRKLSARAASYQQPLLSDFGRSPSSLSGNGILQRFGWPDLGLELPDFGFDPRDIVGDLFDITLPSDPIEAIELVLSLLESSKMSKLYFIFPGLRNLAVVLRGVLEMLKAIQWAIDNKEQIIADFKVFVEARLDEVQGLVKEKLNSVLGFVDERHFLVVWEAYMLPMLGKLKDNWWATVKTSVWETIWPFEGITSVAELDKAKRVGFGKDLGDLWDNFKAIFNNLTSFEFSKAIDHGLQIQKNIMAITNRFAGWVSIIIIAVPTVAGAVAGAAAGGVGAVPGALAGFGTGSAAAAELGLVLLAVTAAVEGGVLLKSTLSLHALESAFVEDTKAAENHIYYRRIAESSIALGLMGALVMLASLGGKIASKIATKVVARLPAKYQAVLARLTQIVRKGKKGELDALEAKTNPPEIKGELDVVRERVKSPEHVKSVSDPELMKSYDFEVRVGNHNYRRRKSDGTWCRFSKTLCNIDGLDDANAQLDRTMGAGTGAGAEFKVGERITMPYKGSTAKAEIVAVKDGWITVRYRSKAKERGTVTQKMPVERFEKLIEDGTAVRWSAERTRLMRNRPKYEDGLVDKVWKRAIADSPDGIVRDPNPPYETLNWNTAADRWDQWHMGHKPGHEYRKLVDDYVAGDITWEKFLKEYNNPNNYQPEDPLKNIGHGYEEK